MKKNPSKCFISESTLEQWTLAGEIIVENSSLISISTNLSWSIKPSFLINRLIEGDDNSQLLGKVLTRDEISSIGAELFNNSLLLFSTAYEGVTGYMLTPQ